MKAYMMSVREIKEYDKEKKHLDKIGGYPTHLPPKGNYIEDEDCFMMQIYNDKESGIWPYKEGVLCWQFYQSEFGGPITSIIEVPIGAGLNIENQIEERRWLNEYVIEYQEIEEEIEESLSDDDYDNCILYESKVGGYCTRRDKNCFENAGCEYVAMISDALCPNDELNLGTCMITILRDKKNGKLICV